jgi:hypothetical protein
MAGMMAGMMCYAHATDMSKCTEANGCKAGGYCMRSATEKVCSTAGSGCDGCDKSIGCDCGKYVMDQKSCSRCSDSCPMQFNQTACGAIKQCSWTNFCTPKTTPSYSIPCRLNFNKTACMNDNAGCFWMNVSQVLCGQDPMNIAMCTPCNDPTFGSLRSVLSRQQVGQSCNWPAAAPFTQGAQVTLSDFATAAAGVGSCKAVDAAKSSDLATISSYFSTMGVISATAKGTCAGMSGQQTPVAPPAVTTPPPSNPPSAAGKVAKGKNAKGKAFAKGKANAKGKAVGQAQAAGLDQHNHSKNLSLIFWFLCCERRRQKIM